MTDKKPKITAAGRIALTAVMSALLILGKLALSFIPNIEVVTTLIIVFAYVFDWQAIFATLIFCLCDMIIYPFSIDVAISYFIYWNLLAAAAVVMRKCGVTSSAWYLLLGLVMTALFGVITSAATAIVFNLSFAAIYLSGLLFYALHVFSTLVFMNVAFSPLVKLLEKIKRAFCH